MKRKLHLIRFFDFKVQHGVKTKDFGNGEILESIYLLKLNLSQYNGINFYTPWYIQESCILISQLLKKHTHLRHLQLLSHQSCDISPSCTNPKIKEGQQKKSPWLLPPPNFFCRFHTSTSFNKSPMTWPKVCLADSTDETPQSWFPPGFCSIFWYEEIIRRQAFYMAPNVFLIFQEMFISKNERCLNSRCLDFPVISREFSGSFCSMPRLSSKMPVAHGIWGKIEATCDVAFNLDIYIRSPTISLIQTLRIRLGTCTWNTLEKGLKKCRTCKRNKDLYQDTWVQDLHQHK